MKSGRTLNELAAELTRQAASKRDYIADTRALALVPDATHGVVMDGVNGGMPLRATAHEQLASTLQIPAAYYKRMLENAPDLLARNANHWLQAGPAQKLIRTLDGGVRAVLSDKYRPLDSIDLAEAVLPKLIALGATVLSGEVTERRFYLKAVTPKIVGEVKKGSPIQAGVVVSNSEIGEGGLNIDQMSYVLACLNGAIHARLVRQVHIGKKAGYSDADLRIEAQEFLRDSTRAAADKAFFMKVQDMVAGTLTQEHFDKLLDTMRDATERKIEADPVKVVEVVQKRFGLGDAERGSILRHLIEGADLSAFGLANAITRTSQDVESYDLATDMEAAGGKILEIPASDWKVMAG